MLILNINFSNPLLLINFHMVCLIFYNIMYLLKVCHVDLFNLCLLLNFNMLFIKSFIIQLMFWSDAVLVCCRFGLCGFGLLPFWLRLEKHCCRFGYVPKIGVAVLVIVV